MATHASDTDYVSPSDPAVLRSLRKWGTHKFGVLVSFSAGAQWAGSESWNLCSEDEPWIARHIDDYDAFKKAYQELPRTYAPTAFRAADWAAVITAAGARYAILPTKHHDGFCLWDTKTTDYKTTGPDCGYASSPEADMFGALTTACRAENLSVGAYFSKADWHSDDYWWRYFATPNRNVNYDPERYPERWKRFVDFTHRQLDEVTSSYGQIDILWLDAGWVRPLEASTSALDPELVGRSLGASQDIDMRSIAERARQTNPGMIIVDRTVHGAFENYLTPEQGVPDEPLTSPWEACITLGRVWHSDFDDELKSANEVLDLLIAIVARGGNLLLGIGPDHSGALLPEVAATLKEIGAWLGHSGAAIYGTKAAQVSESDGVFYTADATGSGLYALIPHAAFEDDRATFSLPDGTTTVSWLGPEVGTVERQGLRITLTRRTVAPVALALGTDTHARVH